jgi:hypothetical protein
MRGMGQYGPSMSEHAPAGMAVVESLAHVGI